jgi:hypothetical protein
MPVGPGFLVSLFHKEKEAILLDFFMGNGAFQPDFPFSHFDDFPVSPPGAALESDFITHLSGIGAEKNDPMADCIFCHNDVPPDHGRVLLGFIPISFSKETDLQYN